MPEDPIRAVEPPVPEVNEPEAARPAPISRFLPALLCGVGLVFIVLAGGALLYRRWVKRQRRIQAETFYVQAERLRKVGQLPDAIGGYRKAIKLAPKHFRAYYGLGSVLAEQGRHAEAADALQRAGDLALGVDSDWAPVSYYYFGVSLGKQRKWAASLRAHRKAVELAPTNVDYRVGLGCQLQEVDKPDEALRVYREAVKLAPENAGAHEGVGCALFAKADYAAALTAYDQAAGLAPRELRIRRSRALTLKKMGRFDNAIADYTAAIRLEPGHADTYADRGQCYRAKGEVNRAMADYATAIRLDSGCCDAYLFRGQCRRNAGELEKAIADYTRAIELKPEYGSLWSERANAYNQKRDFARALADHRQGLKVSPDDVIVCNNYSWFLATCPEARFRDAELAVKLGEKAVAMKREGWRLDTLAAAYAAAGRFDEAIKTQKEAVSLAGAKARKEYAERLKLYEARKPYRTP